MRLITSFNFALDFHRSFCLATLAISTLLMTGLRFAAGGIIGRLLVPIMTKGLINIFKKEFPFSNIASIFVNLFHGDDAEDADVVLFVGLLIAK